MSDEELINLLVEIKDLRKREKDNETYLLAYYRKIDELNVLRTENELLRTRVIQLERDLRPKCNCSHCT